VCACVSVCVCAMCVSMRAHVFIVHGLLVCSPHDAALVEVILHLDLQKG
jgi:hypothetical protein